MREGAVETGEFVEMLKRNQADWHGGIRCIASKWGLVQGAPPHTATLIWGGWPDEATMMIDKTAGNALNVAMPQIPERTVMTNDGHIRHRGWRHILAAMVNMRAVRPTEEIKRWLGEHEFNRQVRSWH